MRVLSRDPGTKPGYVELDGITGRALRASHKLEPWVLATVWDIACTEGQWWYPGCEADPNRLFKLAFEAGWALRGIPALRYMRIPPSVWRGKGKHTTASKAQIQRLIVRELTTDEKKLFAAIPPSRHGDCIDGIGIGRGAIRVASTTAEYDIHPPK